MRINYIAIITGLICLAGSQLSHAQKSPDRLPFEKRPYYQTLFSDEERASLSSINYEISQYNQMVGSAQKILEQAKDEKDNNAMRKLEKKGDKMRLDAYKKLIPLQEQKLNLYFKTIQASRVAAKNLSADEIKEGFEHEQLANTDVAQVKVLNVKVNTDYARLKYHPKIDSLQKTAIKHFEDAFAVYNNDSPTRFAKQWEARMDSLRRAFVVDSMFTLSIENLRQLPYVTSFWVEDLLGYNQKRNEHITRINEYDVRLKELEKERENESNKKLKDSYMTNIKSYNERAREQEDRMKTLLRNQLETYHKENREGYDEFNDVFTYLNLSSTLTEDDRQSIVKTATEVTQAFNTAKQNLIKCSSLSGTFSNWKQVTALMLRSDSIQAVAQQKLDATLRKYPNAFKDYVASNDYGFSRYTDLGTENKKSVTPSNSGNASGNKTQGTGSSYKYTSRQMGLTYKVQLFIQNTLPPVSAYAGLSPVSTEKLADGSTAHLYGNFSTTEQADKGLKMAQSKGFTKSLVVAYQNGVRMSYETAKEMLKTGKRPAGGGTTTEVNPNASGSGSSGTGGNIAAVKGTVYCVQVGYFNEAVGAGELKNVSQPYYEKTSDGKYRYFSGAYTDYQQAVNEQKRLRSAGYPDAFVVAYRDGRRVTLNEAKKSAKITKTSATSANGELYYRVQLASYKGEAPADALALFEKLGNGKRTLRTSSNGLTIYQLGDYANYSEALQAKDRAVQNKLTDSFIVAYHKGKKIPVDEARKLE